MPPLTPSAKTYESLASKVAEAEATDFIRQNELPAHLRVRTKMAKILQVYGQAVVNAELEDHMVTPWYLNPAIKVGGVNTYYGLSHGIKIAGLTVNDAHVLKVKVVQPHPVNNAQSVEVEEPVAIAMGTTFSHDGVQVTSPMYGLVFPNMLTRAMDSNSDYFKDFEDTVDFIAQEAAKTPVAQVQELLYQNPNQHS